MEGDDIFLPGGIQQNVLALIFFASGGVTHEQPLVRTNTTTL